MKKKELKIDLVYLWVDGNDENWRKEKEKWAKACNIVSDAANDCRFIDNEELRYSLRSVEQNAPWINKIYIVTNGQVPKWLNTSHPKIQIITHDQIMPKDALPTFNSEAIETCIANIPGLSEYFLYANDDCFIGKPVFPDYFFDKNGKPIVRLLKQRWKKEKIAEKLYMRSILYSMNLIKEKFNVEYKYESCHNIEAFRKSYMLECVKEFKEDFDRTARYKFRSEPSVQKTIYSYYMLAKKIAIFKECEIHFHLNPLEILYMTINTPSQMRQLLDKNNPKLFCINDDETVNYENRAHFKYFLVSVFNKVQPWEKEKIYQIKSLQSDVPTISVVFALNNSYLKYFSVVLQSLIVNANPQYFYDVVVLEVDISETHKQQIKKILPANIHIRFYNISEFFYEKFSQLSLVSKQHWSIEMYFRLFIPFVMQEYKRVLYLDTDMCVNNDLVDLFFYDVGENEIAAVKDTISPVVYLPRYAQRKNFFEKHLQMSCPENYFNSGMILFNIKQIGLEKYLQRLLEGFKLPVQFPDQDILNYIFNENVCYVENKWNYMYGWSVWDLSYINNLHGTFRKLFLKARQNPCIIHYTSSRKPWNFPMGEYADIWWKNARQTPFYEEILFSNIKGNVQNIQKVQNIYQTIYDKESINWYVTKDIVKLCGLPLLKFRRDPNSCRVYLFKVIPLYKITYRKQQTVFKLFNFLPLFKMQKI